MNLPEIGAFTENPIGPGRYSGFFAVKSVSNCLRLGCTSLRGIVFVTSKVILVSGVESDLASDLLQGNGDGTFRDQVAVPVGGLPIDVALADLDGDGKLDIIAASSSGASVLLGHGDGTFAQGQLQPVRPGRGQHGHQDHSGRRQRRRPSRPRRRTFQRALQRQPREGSLRSRRRTFDPNLVGGFGAVGPVSVAAGDLDGDGHVDLVAVSFDGSSGVNGLTVLRTRTSPRQRSRRFIQESRWAYPRTIALADVDGDGMLDIVIPSNQGNSVIVYLNAGDGTFGSPVEFGVGATPSAIAVGDLNGDGRIDFVTGNWNASTVSPRLNKKT